MQTSEGAEFHLPQMPMDTLTMAKLLESYGTPQRQAEGLAMVLSSMSINHVATKADIKIETDGIRRDIEELRKETKIAIEELRKETKVETDNIRREIEELRKETKMAIANTEVNLKAEMTNIEARLKVEMADIKADLLKWVIPLLLGQLAAIAGLLKMFIN